MKFNKPAIWVEKQRGSNGYLIVRGFPVLECQPDWGIEGVWCIYSEDKVTSVSAVLSDRIHISGKAIDKGFAYSMVVIDELDYELNCEGALLTTCTDLTKIYDGFVTLTPSEEFRNLKRGINFLGYTNGEGCWPCVGHDLSWVGLLKKIHYTRFFRAHYEWKLKVYSNNDLKINFDEFNCELGSMKIIDG